MFSMKCFLKGMIGAFVVLLIAAIAIPQYADYSDRAKSDDMLHSIDPLKQKLASLLINQLDINSGIVEHDSRFIDTLEVFDSGEIFIKGMGSGSGQISNYSGGGENIRDA